VRVLISTPVVGGVGGLERSVFEICRALPNADIDVYSTHVISRGFVPSAANVRIGNLDDWSRLKALGSRTYDVYLQLRARSTVYLLQDGLDARVKLLVPCGHATGGAEVFFDYVLSEANDGSRYVRIGRRSIVVPPPVTLTTAATKEVSGLPSRFFLTVFNPYSLDRPYSDGVKPAKGYDVLYWVAARVPCPIVWAYSDVTLAYPQNRIRKTKNVVLMRNLSQEEIAYLYEHAAGYVCFSREEGFGWSMADALLRGLPVFSRDVGVVTLFERGTRGFHLYETREELVRLLNEAQRTGRVRYDTRVLAPERFRQTLAELCSASVR